MESNTAKSDDTHMESVCNDSATWSFVQMNMSLLPIARPLPVNVAYRVQEGAALAGVKPSTPTQKLHHRVRLKTSNISPRRQDIDSNRVRSTTSTPSSNWGLPPTPKSTGCGVKRKYSETWHGPSIDTSVSSLSVSGSLRMRSLSEDLYPPAPRSDSGYYSDYARQTPLGYSPVHRSASLPSGCVANGLYKGKRILELQDEDRRLHPDDHSSASPSKRSKR